ncbi:serine hydrolase [Glaciecola sp. KUL10]|uniref:serine hydrolase domain-containing protein n=1 Tax=Glaciecola sp. (strain KUL10) TaxID=2161813 RepID=UPI000D7823D7|nr:serine hydrolase domain-containing protein [Glaciecola sp. KUL10]GBL04989.1 beta-lactamase [Glaciecola sp. KUL10]
MKNLVALSLMVFLTACNATTPPKENLGNPTVKQGLSSERLTRINDRMQEYIDQQKLVGISTLVARNGQVVHFAAQGQQDREKNIPLSRDTIFRIYSMTKPVTAVAALTLWEEGKFHMNDPIDMYLPQLKDLQVYVSGEGDNIVTEKQKQPIRIIDLFMHTAGLSYGFSQSPVDKLYQQMFATANFKTADEMLDAIAKLPLNHQPGEKWHYGVNTDIIGFLVEKLSGKKLGEYMQEVIFEPLKMNDTGFYVTADKRDRLKQIYTVGDKGQTVVRPVGALGDYQSDPQVHNGGGGLVSTMDDYLTFAQMLLNGGEVNGTRILGRKTVEYMRTNHMPKHLVPFEPGAAGEGYGLAVSVTVDEGQLKFMGSEGNFGWGGMASTYVRIDPKENMIILGMSQFVPIGFHRYHDDLRNLVYQALVD